MARLIALTFKKKKKLIWTMKSKKKMSAKKDVNSINFSNLWSGSLNQKIMNGKTTKSNS
jgi:hypothetical protein